jgi:hypothetical protein
MGWRHFDEKGGDLGEAHLPRRDLLKATTTAGMATVLPKPFSSLFTNELLQLSVIPRWLLLFSFVASMLADTRPKFPVRRLIKTHESVEIVLFQ